MRFLLDIDRLKNIQRRSYIADGTRRENSAEHSWHVAMCAWVLSNYLAWNVSKERLLQLALVHDLGEIEAGDTFLYASDRLDASERERAAVARLAQRNVGLIPDLEGLWDEQERGHTKEARLVKIADRILPFVHSIANGGRTWKENGVRRSQVLAAHAFIESDAPDLFEWFKQELERAVSKGWLTDS
jgi:5'-deoxynucleotidase YfbR-like HD superfamily hydrolase